MSDSIAAARGGCREALGRAIGACRRYLLLVAERELSPAVRAKEGASDLVQEALLEAQRDFARFEGRTETELRAWLRRLLRHKVAHAVRRYRGAGKRQVAREVPLGGGRDGAFDPAFADDTLSPGGKAARRAE